MWDNIVLCHWGWNVSTWQWATNPFSQINVWQWHDRYDKCTIQLLSRVILGPNRAMQRSKLLKFKAAMINIFILTMDRMITCKVKWVTHKLDFHPNVAQILIKFSEDWQKRMQICVLFYPLMLCKYWEVVLRDKQQVALILLWGDAAEEGAMKWHISKSPN